MTPDLFLSDAPTYSSLMVLTDLFLKGILILAGARILTALLSRSAAAARHLVWAVALIMILLLPIFSVLPKIHVPIFEQPFQSSSERIAITATSSNPTSLELSREAGELATIDRLDESGNKSATIAPLESEDEPAHLAGSGIGEGEQISSAEAPIVSDALSVSEIEPFWTPFVGTIKKAHWTSLVMGLWLIGAFLVIGWTIVGVSGAWWITRRAKPAEGELWLDLNEELADRLMVYRPVRLLMSASISSPMTWGIWRPVVLLPVDADDWTEERRRYVLLHELSHIKRWDTLTQFIAQLGCALHWFNPLAWRSLQRMRIEQEKACDDLVLSHSSKASEYARHLLDIARSLKMPWVSPLNTISMAKPSQLEGRVVDILDPGRKKRSVNKVSGVLTCALALSLMLPISALSPWQTSTPAHAFTEVLIEPVLPSAFEGATKDVAEPVLATRENTARRTGFNTQDARDSATRSSSAWSNERSRPAVADTTEEQRRARKRAIAGLRKALEDESADIRRHAAMTLAEMNDTGSIGALIRLLKNDPDADVRRHAVAALGEFRDEVPVAAYKVALNDSDKNVRRFAVMALSEHSEKDAVNALIQMLDDPDADLRRFAVIGVAENGGEEVTDLLIKMLDDKDSDVRRHALIGLADRNDPKALPSIKKALSDQDPDIRRFAVMALSEYDDDASLQLLREALKDQNKDVRRHALLSIASRADEENLPLFIDLLLNEDDADIRKHAAMALADIGDIGAVDALTKALQDEDVEVRRQAAFALSELDYGEEEAWEDDDDWDEEEDDWGEGSLWDDDEFEGAEEFGEAMAQIGISAGQVGLAIGEMTLDLTAGVLSEVAVELGSLDLEHELALAQHELDKAEMELAFAEHDLAISRLDLESILVDADDPVQILDSILFYDSEELLESDGPMDLLVKSLNALDKEYDDPEFCERLVKSLRNEGSRDARKILRKIECMGGNNRD